MKTWTKAPLLSPKGMIIRGILIAIVFAVCHALGLREHTSFLSGTSASIETSLNTSAILGVTYIASYFGFVILTPILLIAAGIQALLNLHLRRRTTP